MSRLENARYRRRNWNRNKSHLPKHSSVPEFQLLPPGRPYFHCRRCGFTNTLIPLCLWCTWSSQEAEHEFDSSTPRARRASAPAKVFFQLDLQPALKCTPTSPTSVNPSFRKRGSPCSPPRRTRNSIAEKEETVLNCGLGDRTPDAGEAHRFVQQITAKSRRDIDDAVDVPTATQPGESNPTRQDVNINPKPDLRDPLSIPLPGEEQSHPAAPTPTPAPAAPPSVDRPPSPMTVTKSPRSLKASRRMLLIDLHDHDTKTPSSPSHDDDDQLTILTSPIPINQDGLHLKPSSPIRADILPRQQQLRTLRRKKHFNLMQMQTAIPDAGAAEPIAISLTLRSPGPASQRSLKLVSPPPPPPQAQPSTPTTRRHSRPLSQSRSITSISSAEPMTPPLSLSSVQLPPPLLNTAPAAQSPSLPLPIPSQSPSPSPSPIPSPIPSPSSSPVRLGHPSRPYYSAIRKNGISPPPSRPSSLIGPSPAPTSAYSSASASASAFVAGTRPQSYTPPSSFPLSLNVSSSPSSAAALNSTTASRHLSMSALFVGPPSSTSMGMFSAFSVMDADGDNDNDDGDTLFLDEHMPVLPPTPAPARVSFSLGSGSGSRWRERERRPGHVHSQSDSSSSSQARTKTSGSRGSIGFSMSGETELRMALALAAAAGAGVGASAGSAGIVEGGFRFRETAADYSDVGSPSGDAPTATAAARPMHPGSRNSFMGRVRKLRKGIKEMLLMTSTTTATTTAATITTTPTTA